MVCHIRRRWAKSLHLLMGTLDSEETHDFHQIRVVLRPPTFTRLFKTVA
jgi:hypothetical protein